MSPQFAIILYQYLFLGVYAVHPAFWGYDMDWENVLGRWALRFTGHGWAMLSGGPTVLVRGPACRWKRTRWTQCHFQWLTRPFGSQYTCTKRLPASGDGPSVSTHMGPFR